MFETDTVFVGAGAQLKNILVSNGIIMDTREMNIIIDFIADFYVYEIEEKKYRPQLLIGRNISITLNRMPALERVCTLIREGDRFEKVLKSFVPFCGKGWCQFIDVNEAGKIQHIGIAKTFVSVTGQTIEDEFATLERIDGAGAIMIGVLTRKEIYVKEVGKSEPYRISRQFADTVVGFDAGPLIADLIPCAKGDRMGNAAKNLARKIIEQSQGSLLMILKDASNAVPANINCIILDAPLSYGEILLHTMSGETAEDMPARYESYTDVLTQMMNIDGITVINQAGQVIAFNGFIREIADSIEGGARRRAYEAIAQAILRSDDGYESVAGVLFVSQDGMKRYHSRTKS